MTNDINLRGINESQEIPDFVYEIMREREPLIFFLLFLYNIILKDLMKKWGISYLSRGFTGEKIDR